MSRTAIRYDVELMRHDMALRGWAGRDLARMAGVSDATITRFLSGRAQTARIGLRLAVALGHPVARYLSSARRVA